MERCDQAQIYNFIFRSYCIILHYKTLLFYDILFVMFKDIGKLKLLIKSNTFNGSDKKGQQ
jgi:hypothetical protein